MQNIYYFTPLTFFPQSLCFNFAWPQPQTPSPIILHENAPDFSFYEIPNKNSSKLSRGDLTGRESDSLRGSVQCKIAGRPQKCGRNFHGRQQDEEFRLRTKPANGIVYKKKNTESNIINQVFSYVCTHKSKKAVMTFFNNNEQKVNIFFSIMEKIKRSNKKYINRKFISRLIDPQGDQLLQRTMGKVRGNLVEICEVRRLLRVLIHRFLREDVNTILLTSPKISKDTLPEHFWRKRQIFAFLFERKMEQA